MGTVCKIMCQNSQTKGYWVSGNDLAYGSHLCGGGGRGARSDCGPFLTFMPETFGEIYYGFGSEKLRGETKR